MSASGGLSPVAEPSSAAILGEQFVREARDDILVVIGAALDRVEGVDHRGGEDATAEPVVFEQQRPRARARGGAGRGDPGTAGAANNHIIGFTVERTGDHGESRGVVPAAVAERVWRLPAQSSGYTW